MKVSGFTFARNAVKYDYPIVESITSILPIVDEFIVSIGDSEDDTVALINSIKSSKLKIINSTWNMNMREGGKVLALETDKAMDATAKDSDWLFYLQADEVVHEKYLPAINRAMEKYKDDSSVEGLLFKYLHFYGSYKYIGDGRMWYANEIRVIKNRLNIRSYLDAQGFRKNGLKLNVKKIDACIYHYGYVKNPVYMQKKTKDISRFWNDDKQQQMLEQAYDKKGKEFNYAEIDTLDSFQETHPYVMKERIEKEDWGFIFDIRSKKFKSLRHRILYILQDKFGWRPFEYRNYNKI